jgi:hypothetical protein
MLSSTKKDHCCAAERTSFVRRLRSFAGWTVPGAVLVLIPKCPFCIIAYVALISGIGLSIPAAANLRITLIAVSSALLIYFAASFLLSLKRS